jgi:predicted dehydrogenase
VTLPSSRIDVAVVGAGAFGRNHARVYHELEQQGEPVHLAAIVDADPARADAVAREFNARAFGSLDQLLTWKEIQAASIAVPTRDHLSVARPLIEAGIDVLVEKPIASTLAEAEELVRLATQHQRIAQVGHLERFNAAVRATYPLLNHPLFFEVHRMSVFTPRALDVDVVLDLMIHDIDIVLSFVNSPVEHIHAVGLAVLTDKVDIANVRLEFASGCVANLTASRVSTERVRKVRFFQPHQYLSIDYGRQDLLVFTVNPSGTNPVPGQPDSMIQVTKPVLAAVGAGVGTTVGATVGATEEPLRAELRSFLAAVRTRSRPVVSFEDARNALAVALDILSAIQKHSQRIQLPSLR